MTLPAWRTVVIDQHCRLSLSGGRLAVKTDEKAIEYIPLFDVRTIIVVSLQASITTGLINQLSNQQINVIFCDHRKQPYGQIIGYYDNHAAAAGLAEQIKWKCERRREVWNTIINHKLKLQRNLLMKLKLESDWDKWQLYIDGITDADVSNREGQAARLYFNALFGSRFRRRRESEINSALNYGYAILASDITRCLTVHGYQPCLGIAHRGRTNSLNFTYDLIEPFRPWVDEIVYRNHGRILDKSYKRELILVTGTIMKYHQKRLTLSSAIDAYILDVTKALTTGTGMPEEPELL